MNIAVSFVNVNAREMVVLKRIAVYSTGDGNSEWDLCLAEAHYPVNPFLEIPDDLSGPVSYFMRVMFTLKIKSLLVLKAKQ